MAEKMVELELMTHMDREKSWGVSDGSTYKDTGGKKRLKIAFLPKSLVERHVEGKKEIYVMPEWLAKEKELI